MMKKHSFRGKLVFSILLVLSFFVFYSNVYAEDTQVEKDNELLKIEPNLGFCNDFDGAARERCKAAVNKCSSKLNTEVNNYNIHATVNGQDILQYKNPKIGDYTKNKEITVTNNGKSIKSGQKISSERFNTVEFSSELAADIKFKDNNNSDININCNGSFKKIYMFDDSTPPTTSSGFNNPSCKTGGMCYKYLNGKKTGDEKLDKETYKYKSLVNKGNVTIKGKSVSFPQYLAEHFSYCDCNSNPQVSYILSDNYIKKMLASLAVSFLAEYDLEKSYNTVKEKDIPIVFDPNYIELTEKDSKNLSFTCTAFGPQTLDANGNAMHINKYQAITDKDGKQIKDSTGKVVMYNNVRKFAKKGKEQKQYYKDKNGNSVAACSVQCGEEVEVTYGPPIAVKGTVCFQYYVTVKSKIKCQSKILSEKPTPPEPTETTAKTCKMEIKCNSFTGVVQIQAGPKEEFDNCVKNKFNGKYTQKAINYCYKKVYKKSNTTKVNNSIEDILPRKVADDERWWCDDKTLKEIDKAYPNAYNGHTIEDVWKAVQKEAQEGLRGNYKPTKNIGKYGYKTYEWKPATTNCRWDKYADIYKYDSNVVKLLVYDDEIFSGPGTKGYDNMNWANIRNQLYTETYNGSKYYWANSFHQIYYFAKNGAKTAHYTNTNTDCTEKCEIFTRENTNTCNIPGSTIEPKFDDNAWEKYKDSIVSYEEAVAKCAANLECTENDKAKTTTYTMGANQCTKVDSKGKCTQWKESTCTDRDESGACKNWKTSKVCTSGPTDEKTCQNEWDKPSCVLWNEKKDKQTSPVPDISGKNPYIILKNAIGICYGDSEKNYHYINRISFPGTYLDTTKGITHRNPDCDGQDIYSFQKDSFCVDPALPNINTKWWLWDQGNEKEGIDPRDQSKKPAHKTETDTLNQSYLRYAESDADYNIKGVIENFGYLGWNINVSCFYAINNDPPTKEEDCKEGDEKCKTTIENVDTKPISLTDLFPASDDTTKNENVKEVVNTKKSDDIVPKKLNSTKKDETGTVVKVANEKEETGRTPGYNWTCDATDTRIKADPNSKNYSESHNYIVAPVALRKQIEDYGDSVIGDEKELDYRIVLTSQNLKEIKNYNKEKENGNGYYSFNGSVNKNVGEYIVDNKPIKIHFYVSEFLKNDTYVSKIEKPQDFYCNNFREKKCYDYSKNKFFGNSGCEKETK